MSKQYYISLVTYLKLVFMFVFTYTFISIILHQIFSNISFGDCILIFIMIIIILLPFIALKYPKFGLKPRSVKKSMILMIETIVKSITFALIIVIRTSILDSLNIKRFPIALWNDINVAHLFVGFLVICLLLTTIGWDLIDVFFKNSKFGLAEKIVISFSLSSITIIIIGASCYILGCISAIVYILLAILLISIMKSCYTLAKLYSSEKHVVLVSLQKRELILLAYIINLFLFSFVLIYFNPYLIAGDNWHIVGYVPQVYKGEDIYELALRRKYPVIFSFLLLSLVEVTDIPAWNVNTMLYPLVFIMHALSVFVLLEKLSKNFDLSLLGTTLYLLAGGFAWLAAILFPEKGFWAISYMTLDAYYGDYHTVISYWVFKSTALIYMYASIVMIYIASKNITWRAKIKYLILASLLIMFALFVHIYEYFLTLTGILVLYFLNNYKNISKGFLAKCSSEFCLIFLNISIFLFFDATLFEFHITKIIILKLNLIIELKLYLLVMRRVYLLSLPFWFQILLTLLLLSSPIFVLPILTIITKFSSKFMAYLRKSRFSRYIILYFIILIMGTYALLFYQWISDPMPKTDIGLFAHNLHPKYYIAKWSLIILLFFISFVILIKKRLHSQKARENTFSNKFKIFLMIFSWFVFGFIIAHAIWPYRFSILVRLPIVLGATYTVLALVGSRINLRSRHVKLLQSFLILLIIILSSMSSFYFVLNYNRRRGKLTYDAKSLIEVANWIEANIPNNVTILTTSDWTTYHMVSWLCGMPNVISTDQLALSIASVCVNCSNFKAYLLRILREKNIRFFVINKHIHLNQLEEQILSISILKFSNEDYCVYEIIMVNLEYV